MLRQLTFDAHVVLTLTEEADMATYLLDMFQKLPIAKDRIFTSFESPIGHRIDTSEEQYRK